MSIRHEYDNKQFDDGEIEQLEADAARWRYVRDALGLHTIEENIDRLIEEAKREGK